MKSSLLFCLLTSGLLVPVYADQHGEDHEETPLEEEMSSLNRAWKKVRRAAKDEAAYAEAAKLVEVMVEHAKKSLDMDPTLMAEQDGDSAKQNFKEGYVKAMKETVVLLESLQAAFAAGDQAEVQALVGKINDARKQGHETYKPQDD